MRNRLLDILVGAALVCTLGGCAEMLDSESTQGSLEESCEPGEGFDDCTVVSEDDLLDPAESEGEWRIVTVNEYGSQDVEIDAHAFNGGLLPSEENQGHYADLDELRARVQNVLRINLEAEDAFGSILQTGRTVKYDSEPEDPNFGASSTGSMVCDSITTPEGKLYVDGEELEVNCGRSELLYETSETSTQGSSSGTTGMIKISGGSDEAEFEAFNLDLWFYESLGSEIFNYKRDGNSTRWVYDPCGGWFPCWSKRRVTTTMSISNTYRANDRFTPDPGDFVFSDSKTRSGVDSLKLKEWWVGLGVCADEAGNARPCGSGIDSFGPINTVCASGVAGSAQGSDGTNSSCNS